MPVISSHLISVVIKMVLSNDVYKCIKIHPSKMDHSKRYRDCHIISCKRLTKGEMANR